jgi:hypothetical protein
VVIVGTLFSLAIFITVATLAFISNNVIGRFPVILYRFIECYGFAVTFDFIFCILETLYFGYVRDDWDGDAIKLWNYFHKAENNGVVGVFLTIVLYLALFGLCTFFMYNYIVFIHMNGRLLDIYSRLNSPESSFFLPYDSEVSARYMN